MYFFRYNSDPSAPEAGFISGGSFIIALLMLIAMWRIFTKAGEKGWKCLIPIYNVYVLWRIGWNTEKFWLVFVGSLIVSVAVAILSTLGRIGGILATLAAVVWSIYTIYCVFKMAVTMAHRFNKSTAFGVLGLVIFSIIGFPVLAFSSADYDEARDMG